MKVPQGQWWGRLKSIEQKLTGFRLGVEWVCSVWHSNPGAPDMSEGIIDRHLSGAVVSSSAAPRRSIASPEGDLSRAAASPPPATCWEAPADTATLLCSGTKTVPLEGSNADRGTSVVWGMASI